MPRSRKRRGRLFDGIASFEAIVAAALRAAAGKRRTPVPAAFLANLETEALRLERELRSGRWRPGRYVANRELAEMAHEGGLTEDRAERLGALIRSWMDEDDGGEQRETLEYLVRALDEGRLSDRKLFPEELKGKSW